MQWFQEIPLLLNKNISVVARNPFRILEIPHVPIFQMMNIFWMVRKFVRQDWLEPRLRCINEGVGDEEFDMRLSFSQRLDIVWFVVVIGWYPLWEPHLNNGKLGPFNRMFKIFTRS